MEYKVSIIIPIYNVEKYIEECLTSVISQSLTEGVECILVDDFSSDCSIDVAESFIKSYHGRISFKIIRHECNLGPSQARNTGIRNSNGRYLFFLDSDDTITNKCIESLYALTEEYPLVQVVQGTYVKDNKGSLPYLPTYTEKHDVIKKWLLSYNGKVLVPHNRLIKRDLIFDKELFFRKDIIHEDNLWVFYLAKYVTYMALCKEKTYYHRYNPNSITGNVNISKSVHSYREIIMDMCSHIDPYLKGSQKEHILYTLITTVNAHFYETEKDKRQLIKTFAETNIFYERWLLFLYFRIKNKYFKTKLSHFLICLYKLTE